jgi:DNA-binding NarL/FixJ family response regulator
MYKIAIVDDDELYGFAIRRYLSQEFEVSFFTKISSFLQSPCCYDVVIVDYSIPAARYEKQMDGCDLICKLKETLPNPPLMVLLTGFLTQNNLEFGQEICPQADSFLAKDTALDVISNHIKKLLDSSRIGDEEAQGAFR